MPSHLAVICACFRSCTAPGEGHLGPAFASFTSIRTCMSQGAYSTWSKAAQKETEGLLQRQLRLPECNGLLEVTVVRAEQLTLNTKAG